MFTPLDLILAAHNIAEVHTAYRSQSVDSQLPVDLMVLAWTTGNTDTSQKHTHTHPTGPEYAMQLKHTKFISHYHKINNLIIHHVCIRGFCMQDNFQQMNTRSIGTRQRCISYNDDDVFRDQWLYSLYFSHALSRSNVWLFFGWSLYLPCICYPHDFEN